MSKNAQGIAIVTTDTIAGRTCVPLGPVVTACSLSKSLIGDMAANVKNWTTGGELTGYSELLERTGNIVLRRLAERAAAQGADAVVGVRMVTSGVAEGAAELIGYGTLVRFSDERGR